MVCNECGVILADKLEESMSICWICFLNEG